MSKNIKLPPQSKDAEQSVIGGILLDNQVWENVAEILSPEDFYFKEHRAIYSVMKQMLDDNCACDVVTVSEFLEKQNRLSDVGGLSYLGSLVNNTPGASNTESYAKIVRERSDLRQLIHMSNETAELALNPANLTSGDIVELTEKKLFDISDKKAKAASGFSEIGTLLNEAIDEIDELYQSEDQYTGLSTGFSEFDELTSGLQDADLILVAGRPSMGKSAFAINIAENVAMNNTAVAVFSLEMPKKQLTFRMLSSIGSINLTKLRSGKLEDEHWPQLTKATSQLNETKFFIDDTQALSPSEIRARLRRLTRQHDIGLVIIDYIQLMRIPGVDTSSSRVNEVSQISTALKNLAKEFNIPVVALSQLNRNLESRPNKRPLLSDLRESGSLEQDADLVVFLYRDEYYNEESLDKGIAELIIGKQRNGKTGTVKLAFQGEYSRFKDLSYI